MRLYEIKKSIPSVGKSYKLSDFPSLGDYANDIVYVEKGPRGEDTKSKQYRVSFGPANYEVDWIDVSMFIGAVEVPTPKELIYKGL